MSENRKRFSGAEYRKRAAEKSKKNEEVLAKTPRLTTFFKKTDTGSVEKETPRAHNDLEGIVVIYSFDSYTS